MTDEDLKTLKGAIELLLARSMVLRDALVNVLYRMPSEDRTEILAEMAHNALGAEGGPAGDAIVAETSSFIEAVHHAASPLPPAAGG